ncbi:hypothetical protein [Thiocapsa sp.]|uniref:hypothetical protein n=1 Tax=Thiocapsa sp. TaxID=2024551 RepID=UPI0025E53DFF|nr:hypothetical protein [Thiocapsa sp.]
MSTKQATTKTATRVLTDVVLSSPVDAYLERAHRRMFWVLVAVLLLILLMI